MSINITTLKSNIKGLLDTANTTTAQADLSSNLTSRVQKVLTVNVERLPVQPSFFPCVTMFVESKDIELIDMAGSQLVGRRRGEIDVKLVGLVWIDNMNTADFELKDLADNEIEHLMENIEQVLRADPTLQGIAVSSKPTNVSYHSFSLQEEAHMRAGIMNLQVRVHY